MELKKYLETADAYALADAAETTRIYLTHLAHGHSKASPKLAKRIEDATGGKVTRKDLRPDIFGEAA